MPTTPDRRTQLADAAVELLAERGMRGLTHRAVDARAGVAQGSTSAYFRTRTALVDAVVRRLAELDTAPAPIAADPDPAQLAELIAGVLDDWLSTGRTRLLARYHCFLEATHRPELREVLAHGVVLREQAAMLLAALGAPDPHRAGRDLVAFLDGLLFDRLVGTGSLHAPQPGTPHNRADLTAAVSAALHGLTS